LTELLQLPRASVAAPCPILPSAQRFPVPSAAILFQVKTTKAHLHAPV